MNQPRHFLTLMDLDNAELKAILKRASEFKAMYHKGQRHQIFQGRSLAMLFEKSSTRTRVSFESGMNWLGGHALFLSPNDTQFSRGEPIEDSAKVLSRLVDIIMIRSYSHQMLVTFAENATVPVINGLSNDFHPCQLLADMQTYFENRGNIQGKLVTWVGDGNNMCHSYMNAARQFDFKLNIATPEGYEPKAQIQKATAQHIELFHNPLQAAKGSDLIVTDVWASMGQEAEQEERMSIFSNYQVNAELMAQAKSDALFMHCLPAHRGEEVTSEIIDAPDTLVWDEAENRMHSQNALMEFLLQ